MPEKGATDRDRVRCGARASSPSPLKQCDEMPPARGDSAKSQLRKIRNLMDRGGVVTGFVKGEPVLVDDSRWGEVIVPGRRDACGRL